MFALVIALGALALAILASAILDPRLRRGDADDYGPTRDEISLSL
jgi:hypothetical protein